MTHGFASTARETWLTFVAFFFGCSLIWSVVRVGTEIAAQQLGWLEIACR